MNQARPMHLTISPMRLRLSIDSRSVTVVVEHSNEQRTPAQHEAARSMQG